MKMFTILTKPLDKKDIFITKVKRPLENFIIKKYLKNTQKKVGDKNVFINFIYIISTAGNFTCYIYLYEG